MPAYQTHRIRYEIIRRASGRVYGKNHWDYLDPKKVKTLSQVIGHAGVNLVDYAAYLDLNFSQELTDRSMSVRNLSNVYFVRRELIDLKPHRIIERWNTPKTI